MTRPPQDLSLDTPAGPALCRYHPSGNAEIGIVWVFGAGGGLGGPAGGIYERLASRLNTERFASIQVAYRRPGALQPCIEDTLAGAGFLEEHGTGRLVLVGHSFGGAVVINAGLRSASVIAVAALSSQSAHTEPVASLSPRRLLLIHGQEDEVLPVRCSLEIYRRAKQPKQLILYPGCLHGLDQCRDELDRDLTAWLRGLASPRDPALSPP